jgi:pimeloyl-ACP methyl ester carboxylesterase
MPGKSLKTTARSRRTEVSMSHRLAPLLIYIALIILAAPAAGATKNAGPPLSTPAATMREALTCNGKLAGAKRDPVLLVHGTFADSEINWSWNYQAVLPAARDQTACTVDLPDRSAGDIQLSTEYVVYAIRRMARYSDRRVALITHSQGGLEARWALRWWPDLRRLISDVVMFAPPNNGSAFPDGLCTSPGACAASLYQMRSDSLFLEALNQGRRAFGRVAMTSIATEDDRIFVLSEQTVLAGNSGQISNVAIQDLCPGHQAQHNDLPFDGPTYAIAADALDHAGPADLTRIDPAAACASDTMPGVDRADAEARLAAYTATLVQLLGPDGPKSPGEPPLACYATAAC